LLLIFKWLRCLEVEVVDGFRGLEVEVVDGLRG